MLIDGTLSGSLDVRATLQKRNIPYFNFDYSIQSAVELMEAYLKSRQALDAVIILQDQVAVDEALRVFITKSSLRVMLLDQLTPSAVERLKTLRPVPNYFAIVADAGNMRRLFHIVSRNSRSSTTAKQECLIIKISAIIFSMQALETGLVSHQPDRWNLMLTEIVAAEKLDYLNHLPEMSILLLNKDVCCNLECICTLHEGVRIPQKREN